MSVSTGAELYPECSGLTKRTLDEELAEASVIHLLPTRMNTQARSNHTDTHTRAEGVPTVSQRRGRERERERVLGRHKVEGGSGVWETKRERERDKDAPITFVLFIAITVAVFWWNKLSHGEGQLQMRSLEYLNGFYQTGKRLNGGILHFFISIFHVVSHWKHPENKMIVLDSCLCLKVGFICFKSAEQPEVQHDFTQEKLI